ncbi:MAG: ABC transporter substrate-binding protein [Anaerovibrio sp.]|uniref:ABC transporter substrate-binding protein n=1 Tax=Anaerovibrio sp. TaxID=1872532 RepID=UPI0025F50820|nr:ABC transporter substrate-binding protein [Anaerovibrio sp.]MCR5176782.1 ABC transporter substrate-binding protein [Anaerovibrio sp.]
MKYLNFFVLCGLALIMVAAVGCGGEKNVAQTNTGGAITITDDIGRTVNLAKKPERIVVLSASFLEPLHLLGGNVVGRPSSQAAPEFAKDIPSIGKAVQVDMEKVLALNPDLVIINKGMNEKLIGVLSDNGIPSIVIKAKTYEDVKRELGIFAQLTDNRAKADEAIKEMDGRIAAIKEKLPKDKTRVAVLFSSSQGLNIQLSGSIAGSVCHDFGWENVAEGMMPLDKNPDATPYSMEILVEKNPDVLFVVTMGNADTLKNEMLSEFKNNPGWNTVQAVKDDRVYFLPQTMYLINPGLRYPECYEDMAKMVYPNLF